MATIPGARYYAVNDRPVAVVPTVYEVDGPGAAEPCEISVRFRRGAAIEISLHRYAPR